MFSVAKVSAVLLALTSFAHATITITSSALKGNTTNTITWTSSDLQTDPESFTIEIANAAFNHQFAVGNNIQTTSGSFTFEMPMVDAGPGYSIQFVANSNVNDIITQSATFTIAENDVTSSSTASATGTRSVPAGATPSFTTAKSVATPSATLTESGTTGTGTVASGIIASGTSATTGTSTAPAAATSTSGKNGAAGVHVPVALLAVGIVAGLM